MVIVGVLLGGKFGICTVATVVISGSVIQRVTETINKILKIKAWLINITMAERKLSLCHVLIIAFLISYYIFSVESLLAF